LIDQKPMPVLAGELSTERAPSERNRVPRCRWSSTVSSRERPAPVTTGSESCDDSITRTCPIRNTHN